MKRTPSRTILAEPRGEPTGAERWQPTYVTSPPVTLHRPAPVFDPEQVRRWHACLTSDLRAELALLGRDGPATVTLTFGLLRAILLAAVDDEFLLHVSPSWGVELNVEPLADRLRHPSGRVPAIGTRAIVLFL